MKQHLLLKSALLFFVAGLLVFPWDTSARRRGADDIFGLVAETPEHVVTLEDSYTKYTTAKACAENPTQTECHSSFRPEPGTWVHVSPSLLHGVPKHFFASLSETVSPTARAAELTTTSALVLPTQDRSGDLASPPVTLAPDVVAYGASFNFSSAQMAALGWGYTAWVEESSDNFVTDLRLECGQTVEGPIPPTALVVFHCTNSHTGNPLRGRLVTCSQVSLMQRQPLVCTPTVINIGIVIESQS